MRASKSEARSRSGRGVVESFLGTLRLTDANERNSGWSVKLRGDIRTFRDYQLDGELAALLLSPTSLALYHTGCSVLEISAPNNASGSAIGGNPVVTKCSLHPLSDVVRPKLESVQSRLSDIDSHKWYERFHCCRFRL